MLDSFGILRIMISNEIKPCRVDRAKFRFINGSLCAHSQLNSPVSYNCAQTAVADVFGSSRQESTDTLATAVCV